MKHDGVIYELPCQGFFAITDDDKVSFHWASNDGDDFVDDITNTNLGRLLLYGQHAIEPEVIETINRAEEAKRGNGD